MVRNRGKGRAAYLLKRLADRATDGGVKMPPASIYGESGTGKELIARVIHSNSNRSKGPFMAANFSEIPPELQEEELFGCTRAIRTNAKGRTEGLFVQADKGTVFLDEIGNTSTTLQIKLLKVLQEGLIKPVGSAKNVKVDVRVIFATTADLEKVVNHGTFLRDLFYKVHVAPICVPPLRERRDDIPLLATYFLKGFCEILKKDIIGFTHCSPSTNDPLSLAGQCHRTAK